jgi:3-oxoacyl-[acyl-carrier protein] reductase
MKPQSPYLTDESAIITGSGNGIGRALALEVAGEGARVFLVDSNEQKLADTLAELHAKGHKAQGAVIDLSLAGSAQQVVDQARAAFGSIHMLVHSASPPRREADTWRTVTSEIWDEMYHVNVKTGFELARLVGQHMIDEGIAGKMVYLTSLHAHTPRNLPHYATSKAAMLMLVKEMAKAWARHGIRINALTPGAIAAGGFKPAGDLALKIPMQRLGSAQDVAAMGLTLLIDRFSGYVTGTEVVVDGGLSVFNWFDPVQ